MILQLLFVELLLPQLRLLLILLQYGILVLVLGHLSDEALGLSLLLLLEASLLQLLLLVHLVLSILFLLLHRLHLLLIHLLLLRLMIAITLRLEVLS